MAFSARGVNGAVASSPVGSQEGRTSSFAWWRGTSPHSVHSYPHRQTSQTQNLPNRNQLASISIPSGAKAPFPRIGMPTLRPAMAPSSICDTRCRVRVSLQHRHSQKTPLQDRQPHKHIAHRKTCFLMLRITAHRPTGYPSRCRFNGHLQTIFAATSRSLDAPIQ